MKILVTGGLGFIGHRVVSQLESQGHQVVIVDNETTYSIIPVQELDHVMNYRRQQIQTQSIFRYDVQDAEGMNWVFTHYRPELVIHLASFPRQKVLNRNPQLGSQTMSEGLLNLLELSVRHSVRKFVYVSSSMVYGNFKDTYFDGVDESHVCDPMGQYAIMKLTGELLVRDYYRRTNMSYTIVRPSAVYGPGDVEDRVVSKFLLTAIRGGQIQVNGETESLDFTYVDDVATGIATASVLSITDNKTYNLSRGQARGLLEAAQLAVTIADSGTICIHDPEAGYPNRGQMNVSNARNDFGFLPEIDIEEGFARYYAWLKDSIYWTTKI